MEERKEKTERRRQLLVDKPFQHGLIRLLAAVWLLNTVVLGGFIYYLYAGPVFRVEHLLGQPDIQRLPSSSPQFGALVTLGAIVGLALVSTVGLHMSHQIAGPLAQVKSRLRQVAKGDLSSELRFREADYLSDLPDDFNEMLHSLKKRSRSEIETLRAIEMTLDESSPARERLHAFLEEKEALLQNESTPVEEPETREPSEHADPLALES